MTQPIPLINIDPHAEPNLTIDATQHNPAVRLFKGRYQRWRRAISAPLVLLFTLAPWLTINQAPLLHMDLETRQLHLLGMTFWPDDLLILLWLAMARAFALFAVATFAGRLWCGFACPQTIWSMMFIWVEENIEGSRNQRLKAKQQRVKLGARTLAKHLIWLAISFITGFTFVAFFTTGEGLINQLATFNVSIDVLFWLVFFSSLTYINGGWLREQVCLHMCPYSRFQSVMMDNKSLRVTYDSQRGEPRNKASKGYSATEPKGDCIDCTLCVQVCPVGIDIRQGMQYACIDCGACIDACDSIMKQIDKPTGLIAFSNGLPRHWKSLILNRPRLYGYLILALLSAFAFSVQVLLKDTLEVHIEKDRGRLFHYNSDGDVINHYKIKLLNKLDVADDISLTLTHPSLKLSTRIDTEFHLPPRKDFTRTIQLTCHAPCSISGKTDIQFQFTSANQAELTKHSTFFSP